MWWNKLMHLPPLLTVKGWVSYFFTIHFNTMPNSNRNETKTMHYGEITIWQEASLDTHNIRRYATIFDYWLQIRVISLFIGYHSKKICRQGKLIWSKLEMKNSHGKLKYEHACRTSIGLSCLRCLINTGVEKMNYI